MGCHTWFSVPYKTDKKEIIKLAQDWLDTNEFITGGFKQMYQWAIDNEIMEPVCELAGYMSDCSSYDEPWVLYKDASHLAVDNYNKENNTSIYYHEYDKIFELGIESYSNEPRIGGYPDNIIKSFDEMVEFMNTGFDGDNGKHYDFTYDESRKENFMNEIREFFERHPGGIITFG